jgi:hypothetical protein
MEHPHCFPDLAQNDFQLFPQTKFALKGRMWWWHWKLFHNRSSRNVSNSHSLIGLSA